MLELGGQALANTYYCDNFSVEADSTVTQDFIKRYHARYGEDPDSVAPLAFDAFGMLRDALIRAGSSQPEALRAALSTIKDFPGVSGNITIDAQRNPLKPAYIVTFREGRYRFLEAIKP